MLKALLGHFWLSPIFFLYGWDKFFKEEIHKIVLLHVIAIIGSYVINIFYYFSQWQIIFIIILLRKFMAGGVCYSKSTLHGKVAIVTGACSGIGKETAKDLASRDAKKRLNAPSGGAYSPYGAIFGCMSQYANSSNPSLSLGAISEEKPLHCLKRGGGSTALTKWKSKRMTKCLNPSPSGAKIIMACCNMKRAHRVSEELIVETGGDIIVMELDLASLKSVRSFVKAFRKENDVLDILINNAGVMLDPYRTTEDGFEMTFGVNYLGHFLLTNLLLPTMVSVNDGRIINVASIMHLMASLDLNNLQEEKEYHPVVAYANSKLASMLFSLSLNERLKETNVKVFAVHPGVAQSQLGKNLPFGGDLMYANLLSIFFKSASQAAQTTLYCVLEADSCKCCYYSDCCIRTPAAVAQDKVLANKLWEISENLVDL